MHEDRRETINVHVSEGVNTVGHFEVQDGILSLTDQNGRPINRELYQCKLQPNDNPRSIAAVWTLQHRRTLRSHIPAGFDQPLRYPDEDFA